MAARRLRAAHIALAVIFVGFGAVDGTWAARLPALKTRLGLDSGQLGLVIFCVSISATLLLPVAGWLSSRAGSRGPSGVGLLAGSAIAAGAAAAGAGPRLQFPLVAAGVLAIAIVFVPRLLPGTAADVGSAHFAFPRGALALPAFLTFCSMFVESAAMNWSAVFLSGPAGASAAVAACGVVAFAVAMALARLFGDRLTLRWGVAGLSRRGGALTCAGIALALATRSPAPGLLGFALVGAGCAAIVPALFRVAAAAPGVSAGAGIAAVATAGYTGGVVNGPAIGFLAQAIGLTGALSLIGVAAALIALLGPRLQR